MHTLLMLWLLAWFTPPARAVISEPDNRVWGSIVLGTNTVTAAQTNIVVEARRSLSGPPLASYRMGDNPQAGSFYSLAIPLESVNPISDPNATHTGEQIIVLVHNGQFVRYLTLYTVGPRGRLLRLDLGDTDSDNNGLVDNWERQFFGATGQNPNGDPDRDGVSNRNEMLGGTNPLVPDARHPADTNPTNNVITIGEVTAYALAWKTGKEWPVAPANIPVEFVARAGYLWKNGEKYIMDTNNLAAGAPLWWTNAPTDTNISRNLAPAGLNQGKSAVAKKSEIRNPKSEIQTQPSLVTRSLDRGKFGSEAITVTLMMKPAASASAYGVEETLPDGWSPTEISGDGVFDPASRRLRWGLFFDHEERTVSYRLQAASTGSAFGRLSGSASFDGWSVETAGLDTLLPEATGPQLHPLVLTRNGEVTLKLTGEAGQRYQIQVSSDLIDWSAVATVTAAADGQLEYREHAELADRQRFYRARRVEE